MKNVPDKPFYSGTLSMQKKKKVTFYTICTTMAIIAAMIVFLLLTLLVLFIIDSNEDKPEIITDIGQTESVAASSDMLTTGNLIPISDSTVSTPVSLLINLEQYENRAKTNSQTNAFTVGNKPAFHGTAESVEALNKMLGDFYNATGDDNIYIANAYNADNADEQDPLYNLGTTYEFKYFSAADVLDWSKRDSIYGVELYSWIYANAYKYGFLTLNEIDGNTDQTNVFRYVGESHSQIMKEKGLSLNAYLSWAKAYSYKKPFFVDSYAGSRYAIYYHKANEKVTVPTSYAYTLSGNYVDGYLITVRVN